MSRKVLETAALVGILVTLVVCGNTSLPPTPTSPALGEELVFYDWSEDSIEAVFEAFTEEYGVKITYLTYVASEEAV